MTEAVILTVHRKSTGQSLVGLYQDALNNFVEDIVGCPLIKWEVSYFDATPDYSMPFTYLNGNDTYINTTVPASNNEFNASYTVTGTTSVPDEKSATFTKEISIGCYYQNTLNASITGQLKAPAN